MLLTKYWVGCRTDRKRDDRFEIWLPYGWVKYKLWRRMVSKDHNPTFWVFFFYKNLYNFIQQFIHYPSLWILSKSNHLWEKCRYKVIIWLVIIYITYISYILWMMAALCWTKMKRCKVQTNIKTLVSHMNH